MNRKTFLKLISTTPLIPLMLVKKKESKFLDTSYMKKQCYNNSVVKDKLIPVNTNKFGSFDYISWLKYLNSQPI